MTGSLPRPALLTASALIVATLASWAFGTEHVFDDADTAASIVIVISFIKADLVARSFLELQHGSRALQMAFEGSLALCCLTLLVFLLVV